MNTMPRSPVSADWRQALPALAALVGGSAVLCDEEGRVLATAGSGATDLAARASHLAALVSTARPVAVPHEAGSGYVAAIRVGEAILLLDAAARAGEAARYRRAVEDALPLIAQVAGGDVVMFDRAGTRSRAVHPDGKSNPSAVGVITDLCRKAMEECRPSIGTSVMIPGALAVRVPLAPEFGIAFNNKLAAVARNRLRERAPQHHDTRYHIDDIIGDSPAMVQAKRLAATLAVSPSTVLIHGETGTGKELFAQAIHNLSPRAARPFVAINCGALPASLIESTLFGYAEGSFTGAKRQGAPGVFEQADGGTLFLDEISEMPFDLQVRLLRVIQEREVRRVGAEAAKPVDVRILASTNKSLEDLVRQGKFRTDLYFRLNVLELDVPPLRERKADIPALAYHFIGGFARMLGKEANDIDPAVLDAIVAYDWPGNVRELQNCTEFVVNMLDGNAIRLEHLPPFLRGGRRSVAASAFRARVEEAERDAVLEALRAAHGNKAEAARRLGLNRTTLWRVLKRIGYEDVGGDS